MGSEKDFISKVGKSIKAQRQAKGMTQLELASECNIEPQNLSRIETGRTTPNLRTLHKLALVLGTTVSDLVDV